jgi:hypothetical protein
MQNKPVRYRRNPLADVEISYWAPKTAPARATETPASPRPLPDPSRPTPASRQRTAEARSIAQRVHDRSGSSRLEYLLRRQQNRRYSFSENHSKPKRSLEHLAIAQRHDQGFQIVIRGTQSPFSRYVFETAGHCAEAAAELEQRFELGQVLEGMGAEVVEAVEGIVLAAVTRERVERLCRIA